MLCVQLALIALAVAVAQLMPAGRGTIAIVMVIAAMNGAVVAFGAMGLNRDGWMVSALMAMTFFFIIGLLIWPAWDVVERSRVF